MSIKNTTYSADQIEDMLKDKKSIYFIGIGGVSMSCLALMAQKLGYRVGGSDRTPSKTTERLVSHSITVNYNHFPNNIISYDAIVYTVAISEDNEEYNEAIRRGLPCISRADFLGFLMTRYKNRIGVSGMHGKSTASSMISTIFIEAEKDPTVVLGAELPIINGCYRDGSEDWFIFEACEYMDSFLSFCPTLEVLLNIELDHTDFFEDLNAVKRSFKRYLDISSNKTVVYNCDDENVNEVIKEFEGRKISFSMKDKNADFYAGEVEYLGGHPSYNLYFKGVNQGRISLSTFGAHNVMNSLATAAVAYESEIPFDALRRGLGAFSGAKRRMERKGELNFVEYFEDYAHHPTEIEATIRSAKEIAKNEVWCVFQSHTYSRTAELYDGFISSLSLADRAIILDIYSARETDTLGVSGERMAEDVGDKAIYANSFQSAAIHLIENAKAGDLVLVMGAGDVFHVFDYLNLNK
ncbi:MAG: UDP-N-acetylmuramate--L-alanine ligase [Clostridia bacterium]|nr:UDP-N-acetylmuramate--L-alanine ligase [Clostridia bacterium]